MSSAVEVSSSSPEQVVGLVTPGCLMNCFRLSSNAQLVVRARTAECPEDYEMSNDSRLFEMPTPVGARLADEVLGPRSWPKVASSCSRAAELQEARAAQLQPVEQVELGAGSRKQGVVEPLRIRRTGDEVPQAQPQDGAVLAE